MKFSRYMKAASLATLIAASAGGACADAGVTLGGHVARWVASARKVGVADDGQTVRLTAFLGFRNHDALTRLIARQSTPGSADYDLHLTAAQFRERFGPSAQDEAKVEKGLTTLGFAVTGKPVSNLWVEFTGTVGQVKAAFAVSQDFYAYRGKVIRASARNPSLPASLAGLVTVIGGLDDVGQLIRPGRVTPKDVMAPASGVARTKAPAGAGPGVTLPVADSFPFTYCSTYFGDKTVTLSPAAPPYPTQMPWLNCGYTPQQMRAAYGADRSPLDGSGVTVAITDAYTSPTLKDDANQYSKNHNLPTLKSGSNLQVIYNGDLKKVPNDDPCGPQGWFSEISLDVDAVHTMAPGANILYSGGLSCENSDLEDAIYTVVDGNQYQGGPLADVITNSWDSLEADQSEAQQEVYTAIFEQAAAEGVSVLFCSFDNGDNALFTGGKAEPNWPTSSPLVTAVGGTSLALTAADGTKSEWGWGTFRSFLYGSMIISPNEMSYTSQGPYSFTFGSGGGASWTQAEPGYQAGAVPKRLTDRTYDLQGNRFKLPQDRVVPDVAMDADPYTGMLYGETFLISGNPITDAGCTPTSNTEEYCEEETGGTSLSSPLFAGTLALVDQARKAAGLGDLGLANPRLYALKTGAPGSTKAPLVDVQAPQSPTAVVGLPLAFPTQGGVLSMNSVPGPFGPLCATSVCEGQDSWTLETTRKYDNVTGLGTPDIPVFTAALATAP
jgi:subtilase family serine protease